LHRIDWPRDILHALWPTGLWAAVLLLSLNLVAWPLISLVFGPAEESISVGRALGCVAGLILTPALLIIFTASVWSDLELQSWMRVSARAYADMISSQLRQDLVDGTRILATYRSVFSPFVGDSTAPPRCKRIPERSVRVHSNSCGTSSKDGTTPLFGYDPEQRTHCGLHSSRGPRRGSLR